MRFKSRFYNSQAQGVSDENEQLAQPPWRRAGLALSRCNRYGCTGPRTLGAPRHSGWASCLFLSKFDTNYIYYYCIEMKLIVTH